MVLDDRHISYLRLVQRGAIQLWWAPRKLDSRYVNNDWSNGRQEVDQIVAAQMKALGMTHVVNSSGKQLIELTERGHGVLADEDAAWT